MSFRGLNKKSARASGVDQNAATDRGPGRSEMAAGMPVLLEPSGMTPDQNYCLEVAGFIVVPGVLSPAEITAWHAAASAAGSAAEGSSLQQAFEHAELTRHLEELFNPPTFLSRQKATDGSDGPRWLSDGPVQVLGGAATAAGGAMAPSAELPSLARGYRHKQGQRCCTAVTAVFALTDTVPGGGYVAIAGSHVSEVPAPRSVREGSGAGLRWVETRGMPTEPPLMQGDLLLIAGSTIHGLRQGAPAGQQLLLSRDFCAPNLTPRVAPAVLRSPLPWTEALSDNEQAIIGLLPTPIAEVEEQEETELLKERWLWDLCGYMVIKGVMDSGWLAAANEAVDAMEQDTGGDDAAAVTTVDEQRQAEKMAAANPNDPGLAGRGKPSAELLGGSGRRLGGVTTQAEAVLPTT